MFIWYCVCAVCNVTYVRKHHGTETTILFDGYSNNNLSVKSGEHQRRSTLQTSKDIMFEEYSITTTTQA